LALSVPLSESEKAENERKAAELKLKRAAKRKRANEEAEAAMSILFAEDEKDDDEEEDDDEEDDDEEDAFDPKDDAMEEEGSGTSRPRTKKSSQITQLKNQNTMIESEKQELKGNAIILQKKHDDQVLVNTGLEHANTVLQQQLVALQEQNAFFQAQNQALHVQMQRDAAKIEAFEQARIENETLIESQRVEIINLMDELEKLKGVTTQMNTMAIDEDAVFEDALAKDVSEDEI